MDLIISQLNYGENKNNSQGKVINQAWVTPRSENKRDMENIFARSTAAAGRKTQTDQNVPGLVSEGNFDPARISRQPHYPE
jgi:hypothetical protein